MGTVERLVNRSSKSQMKGQVMMATKFPEDPEYIVNLAKEIQALAAGDPLSIEKVGRHYAQPDPSDPQKLIVDLAAMQRVWGTSVSSHAEVYDLIKITAGMLPDDDSDVEAIKNALGLYVSFFDGFPNLTARRAQLLSRVEITMRSLQDRETRGARLLARQITIIRKQRPEVFEAENLKRRVENLEYRMQDLERQVERLESNNSNKRRW
jgi:hypothetical protein